ncbi:hypothetical protein AB6A40_010901 [Gnathostoma spinigerum]|uniref:Arginine-hydroxylase NDUFAF5, mitochondrial n=1 Tax=Gnathostoma spinigerum TaxID=75299 RepID=A0ABD6EYM6_9BILA
MLGVLRQSCAQFCLTHGTVIENVFALSRQNLTHSSCKFCCWNDSISTRHNSSFAAVPKNISVFDREAKRKQRNRASISTDYDVCQYVKDEFAYRVADKVFDITKFNEVCLDLGCGSGHIAPNIIKENVGVLIQCDMSEGMVRRSSSAGDEKVPTLRVIADEELVPFREDSIDLILSSLSAHWINKIPEWFSRCYSILRPDCAMIGSVLAGDTLHELRVSLQLAETERLGGLSSHISPFIRPQDIAGLMSRAGFDMITLDTDEIQVAYPHMFALLYDLQCMGESNAVKNRSCYLRRDILLAANAIYQ